MLLLKTIRVHTTETKDGESGWSRSEQQVKTDRTRLHNVTCELIGHNRKIRTDEDSAPRVKDPRI